MAEMASTFEHLLYLDTFESNIEHFHFLFSRGMQTCSAWYLKMF